MQKNIGTVNASVRITLGLLGLAYGIGKMSRRPYRTPWVLMSLSAMKVAEGVTRFCPMSYAMGINSSNSDSKSNTNENPSPVRSPLAKIGDKFIASQVAHFAEAIGEQSKSDSTMHTGENKPTSPPVDFDLGLQEILANATGSATHSPSSTQTAQATQRTAPVGTTARGQGQTRHVRARENVRETIRRSKNQTDHYKQDESTYPTYS